MDICKYKNIFGEERKGLHSFRIFDIAIIDLLLTILFAYFISKKYNYNIKLILFLLLILSVIIHKIFCVKTTLTNIFFD